MEANLRVGEVFVNLYRALMRLGDFIARQRNQFKKLLYYLRVESLKFEWSIQDIFSVLFPPFLVFHNFNPYTVMKFGVL